MSKSASKYWYKYHLLLMFLVGTQLVIHPTAAADADPPLAVAVQAQQSDNRQRFDVFSGILQQVTERLDGIVKKPEEAIDLIKTYHKNEGLHPHGLHATGRSQVLSYLYSLIESFDGLNIYFGTELGEYFTYFPTEAVYREPGNSGYIVDDSDNSDDSFLADKYFNICVKGNDGSQEECLMSEGDKYIQCQNDCELAKCSSSGEEVDDDGSSSIWCPTYTIEEVPSSNGTATRYGFVPVSYHCIDYAGRFSQTPGGVQIFSDDEQQVYNNGTCRHWDGTPVTRITTGEFASCQEEGAASCDSTYVGVIRTVDYDPRLRPWYIGTKEQQRANWNSPYAFHSFGYDSVQHIGITYSDPFYSTVKVNATDDNNVTDAQEQVVFEGVFAVDYTLQDISSFLIDDFQANDMVVLVLEAAEPYYTVGISTGFNNFSEIIAPLPGQGPKIYRSVLKTDHSVLCITEEADDVDVCEVVRVPSTDFRTNDKLDAIAGRAVEVQADAGFPTGERITVKETDDFFGNSYVSQTVRYSHAGLEWVILVASPVERSGTDALMGSGAAFAILILIATAGTILCSILIGLWYKNKEKRAVKHGDFLFTAAFVFGCVLLNISSFVSLGENTDAACMSRMWTSNVCLSLVIGPLYAKAFRIHKIMGAAKRMRRVTMDNKHTALMASPIVVVQIVILIVFTIVDPPKAQEEIVHGSGVPQQYIQCEQESNAYIITQSVYSSVLVAIGCVLAFLTRNLDSRFGEAKQLLYGIYNIAFTGSCFILLLAFADVTPAAFHTFRAVAVFWGTVLTCAVFVLPRLFTVRSDGRSTITGLMPPSSNMFSLPSNPKGSDGHPSQPFKVNHNDGLVIGKPPEDDQAPLETSQPPADS